MTDDDDPKKHPYYGLTKNEVTTKILGVAPADVKRALEWMRPNAAPSLEKPRRSDILPRNLPPIGLPRNVAAEYICVSPSKFDEMVKDGRMPKPKRIDARRVWDRRQIEKAFAKLPGGDEPDEDDEWADVS